MAADQVQPVPVRGRALHNFVINSALLYLIDPVRGTPTRGTPTISPYDKYLEDEFLISHQLKEKFLDSFALICSTSKKGAETASAVCLEQSQPSGSILRVARNRGLSPEDQDGLEKILEVLISVSKREKTTSQAESEVLQKVVDLDKDRILSLVEKLKKGGVRERFQKAISDLLRGESSPVMLRELGFGSWIRTCPFTTTTLYVGSPPWLISLVEWASRARWNYPEHLRALLAFDQGLTPPWMETLHKIARYHAAIKSMVKLAVKQPEIFASIQIQGVKAPKQETFLLSNQKSPLEDALKRLVKEDCDKVMEQLFQRYPDSNVDTELRRACRLKLTLHAEMQLTVFYDCNPALTPSLLHMGTSKKACYLCHEFLLRHPLRVRVSACHQKIYPSWMPPPDSPIPGQPKLFWKFSKHIEKETTKDLKTRLSVPRRPKNNDSTAGPSLTTTAAVRSQY